MSEKAGKQTAAPALPPKIVEKIEPTPPPKVVAVPPSSIVPDVTIANEPVTDLPPPASSKPVAVPEPTAVKPVPLADPKPVAAPKPAAVKPDPLVDPKPVAAPKLAPAAAEVPPKAAKKQPAPAAKPKPAPAAKPKPGAVVEVVVDNTLPPEETSETNQKMTAQQRRRYWTSLSLIPVVIVPVIVATFYYFFLASDRYASEVKFTIRAQGQTAPASDLLGAFTGVAGSGSTKTDSYIIVDFLHSRELVEVLEEEINIRNIYGNSNIDWWSRFNKSGTQEDFVSYLDWRIDVSFDTSSQIITVEAQAFSPEEAQLVASKILELSENLINRLSDKAREDTLKSAQNEVDRAEEGLKLQRKKISQFRQLEQDIDPTKTVATQQLILGQLQGELGAAQAQIRSMSKFMQEDAPSMKVIRSKIAALESQLNQERAKLGLGVGANGNRTSADTLTSRVGAYEELAVDLEFLQQAYVLSLASLERARVEADSQLRYIATFVTPRAPGEAKYPKRVLNTFLVLIFSFMIWGIGVIAFYIVREHVT